MADYIQIFSNPLKSRGFSAASLLLVNKLLQVASNMAQGLELAMRRLSIFFLSFWNGNISSVNFAESKYLVLFS